MPTILQVGTALLVGATLVITLRGYARQTQNATNQLKAINATTKSTHDDLQEAKATLEGDMACIGTFFSLPGSQRVNVRIIDLRTCTIHNDETGGNSKLPLSIAGPPAQSPAANNSQGPATPTANNSSGSQLQNPLPPPVPQKPQSFLQRNVVTPTMNIFNKVKGLL